jgi:hypothetical protein
MLRHGPGRQMIVSACIDKVKARSKRSAQAFGVIPRDRQPAAHFGTVKREGADDRVAAGL